MFVKFIQVYLKPYSKDTIYNLVAQSQMSKALICFSILLILGSSMNLFGQVPLTKKNGAMCMDGSQAAIYTYTPDDVTPVNKLMIFFQATWQGWCPKQDLNGTLNHCYKYITDQNYIDYGSSKNYPSDEMFFVGILAFDSIFAAWPKVIIKTCDGGTHFSDASVTFKNKTMHFRGRNTVIETLNYLKSIKWIQNVDQVLLTGQLNGAFAALAWADQVKKWTNGKVRVMVDAAVYENDIDERTNTPVFQSRTKNMQKLFMGNSTFPNQKCDQAHKNDISKCFYASELIKFVDPSIQVLFLQSYYDGWAIDEILGLDCTQQFGSLSECTEQHRARIQDYHKKVSSSLTQMIKLPNVAAFGVACVAHLFTGGRFDDESFSVPQNTFNGAMNVTSHWLANKPDRNHLDQIEWPHNVPCSRKVVNPNPNLLSQ